MYRTIDNAQSYTNIASNTDLSVLEVIATLTTYGFYARTNVSLSDSSMTSTQNSSSSKGSSIISNNNRYSINWYKFQGNYQPYTQL